MTTIENIKKVYFLGIGGIGMSALARYFNEKGVEVFGYDKTATKLTRKLEEEGMKIHYTEQVESIPNNIDWVIYTPAIPKENAEWQHFEKTKIPMLKRAQVLGEISKTGFCIAVAGSHGKTTVSSLITHLLYSEGPGCTAFIGGIMSNYESNYLSNEKGIFVVEADEFDRSFHQLHPDLAVVTAIDSDHLEIYGTHENIVKAYNKFISQIQSAGVVVHKKELPIEDAVRPAASMSYHLTDSTTNFHTENLEVKDGNYTWETVKLFGNKAGGNDKVKVKLNFQMNGLHNVENTLPAVAIAHLMGMTDEQIQKGIASFKGIKRRFEYIVKNEERVVIDDYAHHPEELRMLLLSAKHLYPDKKVSVIFQPHLFSRTQDLASEFAAALSLADQVYLMEIYPAREEPIEGVTSQLIQKELTNTGQEIFDKKNIIKKIIKDSPELLLIAGAGDISNIIEPLRNLLGR